ncbi:MAG: type II secretion system F family protein [Myxococcaceae bacterium]|nr:type II secretion system F family protein [Myxococcaceae bacterium]MCA3012293.1 type II secretion system F family protein [Myxococcaceae bacterium]
MTSTRRPSPFSRNLVSRVLRARAQALLFRQFHVLQRSGISLAASLEQLRQLGLGGGLSSALLAVSRQVASGRSLGQALAAHPDVFEADQVELLAAGEETGRLEAVLDALATHLEQLRQLWWKTLALSLWPAYLVGLGVFVAPLVSATSAGGGSLGGIAGAALSGVASRVLALALTLLAVVMAPVAVSALGLERPLEAVLLGLPVLGGALRSWAASRVMLALGLALGAGLEVARAVRLSLDASGRLAFSERGDEVVRALRAGWGLADALAPLGLFDVETLGQLRIAETTGTLDEALPRLAPEASARSLRTLFGLLIAGLGLVACVFLALAVAAIIGGYAARFDVPVAP